jgi:hypothetical protein
MATHLNAVDFRVGKVLTVHEGAIGAADQQLPDLLATLI